MWAIYNNMFLKTFSLAHQSVNGQLCVTINNNSHYIFGSKTSWFLISVLKHLLVSVTYSNICYTSTYKSKLQMGKDLMENGPRLLAKEGVGCKSKKLRNPMRNGKKILLKWKRACRLSNLPWLLATSSHQKVLLQPVQATINLKSKLLSSGVEPWSVMSNC